MSLNIGNQIEFLRNKFGPFGVMLGECLDQLSKSVTTLTQTIANLASSSSAGTVAVWEQTLAGAADPVSPPIVPTLGGGLKVYLTAGVNGAYPAWSVYFAPSTSVGVNPTAGKVTAFSFTGRSDGLWWQDAQEHLQE